MRYEVRKKKNIYFVWDTERGESLAKFDSRKKAERERDRLNKEKPKPPKPKRKFYVTRAAFNQIEEVLDEGWEPFGVADGFVYMKREKKEPSRGSKK